uniref:Uncharacterized protein n=1 Tax=Anguilla anguilla TaxID=7936 RepID=A0A0E9TWF9_ANGAN
MRTALVRSQHTQNYTVNLTISQTPADGGNRHLINIDSHEF